MPEKGRSPHQNLSSSRLRLVTKIGTSAIAPGGRIDVLRMRTLMDQLNNSGHEYLIVTSGAIACGMSKLGLKERPTSVRQMQACAAVGQSALMHTYEQLFFGTRVVAQLLLSNDDFTSPARFKNLQNVLRQLLRLGVVPIINENDSVSTRELTGAFGDNDELSALVATAVDADWLLLVTDVDGLCIPNGNKRPRLLRVVDRVTPEIESLCNGHGRLGTGGMLSKLHAARVATEVGIHTAILKGSHANAIRLALQCKIGTYFPPQRCKA